MPGPENTPSRGPSRSISDIRKDQDVQMLAREMLLLGAMLVDHKTRQAIKPQAFHTPLCRQMAEQIVKGKDADNKLIAETLKMIDVEWGGTGKSVDAVLERQTRAAMYRRALAAQRKKLDELRLLGGCEEDVIARVAKALSDEERKAFELEGP